MAYPPLTFTNFLHLPSISEGRCPRIEKDAKTDISGQEGLPVIGWLSPIPHHPTSLRRQPGRYPTKFVETNHTSDPPGFPTGQKLPLYPPGNAFPPTGEYVLAAQVAG